MFRIGCEQYSLNERIKEVCESLSLFPNPASSKITSPFVCDSSRISINGPLLQPSSGVESSSVRSFLMSDLARQIPVQDAFDCKDTACRCKLPSSPKKDKSTAGSVDGREAPTVFEPIDPEIIEEPSNFGRVSSYLFRSAYPTPKNYPFLGTLRLKTILSAIRSNRIS